MGPLAEGRRHRHRGRAAATGSGCRTSVPPLADLRRAAGRWVAEDRAGRRARIDARAGSLSPRPASVRHARARRGRFARRALPADDGLASGSWCAFGAEGEMPARPARGRRQVADLRLGAARRAARDSRRARCVELGLACDRPVARCSSVRLNDVSPDGASTRVTYGLLDLTHRDGHERADAARAGPALRRRLAAERRRPRLRRRAPDPARALDELLADRLAVARAGDAHARDRGGSQLELPVRPPRAEDGALRPFPAPESAAAADTLDLRWRIAAHHRARGDDGRDPLQRRHRLDETGEPAMTRIEATGVEHGHAVVERFRIIEDLPLSARGEVVHDAVFRRDGWPCAS